MSWGRIGRYYLLLGVALAYYFLTAPPGDVGAPAAHRKAALLELRADEISAVVLAQGTQSVRCEERKARWRVVDPEDVFLPADLISALVLTLAEAQVNEIVATGARDAGTFGLGSAATRIQVYREGYSAPITLLLGDRNPTQTAVYAKVQGGDDVVLVGRVLQYYTERIFEEVRRQRRDTASPADGDAADRIGRRVRPGEDKLVLATGRYRFEYGARTVAGLGAARH